MVQSVMATFDINYVDFGLKYDLGVKLGVTSHHF